MDKLSIFWFRRDLRLEDNHGLYLSLCSGMPVIPLFIFDTQILEELEDKDDLRVNFIFEEVTRLNRELKACGSSLLVRSGRPTEIFREITGSYPVEAVYANQDYEPYAKNRDEQIGQILASRGILFRTFKDQVIFEKDEILKDNGKPYTIFTPYSRKWKETFRKQGLDHYPSETLPDRFFKSSAREVPSLESMGFTRKAFHFPGRRANRGLISDYDQTRDFPYLNGTSMLGIHLRFGTISIRQLAGTADQLNQTFLNELIWREFYMMILHHFPYVTSGAFKPAYNRIRWINDDRHFQAWCNGMTGYPIVDAGMRELNATGYMHNRLRMITASFLSKHLLIDWRWGEAYFARKLLDFELASNNGGWQWSAGTGCDAAPYFRVFNPDLQAQKYDPGNQYIMKWVPEYKKISYARKIIEHAEARKRALSAYKEALQ